MKLNIVIEGVGGQGTIFISKLLGLMYTGLGHNVSISEVHGMAQRGGSVQTMMRVNPPAQTGNIGRGEADIVIAFEPLEAIRYITCLKKGGKILVNLDRIPPYNVSIKKECYPDIDTMLKELSSYAEVHTINATTIAKSVGNPLGTNVVMLGYMAAAGLLGVDDNDVVEALKAMSPPHFIEANIKAFEGGKKAVLG